MAALPIFEGPRDQVLGDHHTEEPMTRELDHVVPTPAHAIGRLPVLELASRTAGMAAHIAPRHYTEAPIPTDMPTGTTRMPGIFIGYV